MVVETNVDAGAYPACKIFRAQLRASLVVIVLVLVCGRQAVAQDAGALLQSLQVQLRSGQLEAARQTARRYVAIDGANPRVWYNLAGLEEHAGDRPAAAAALAHAVQAGFDDFRAAEADADLGGLRRDPAFLALRDASRRALGVRCAGREVDITAGTWSPWRDLTDREGGKNAPTSRVRLRCTGDNLEVEAEVHDTNPADILPPWQGGAGLVVAVVAPDDNGGCDGARFQEIELGLQKKLPVGAILVGHWQQLVELAPKLRYDPATKGLVYLAKIPWTVLAPHDPLLDADLRLNVTYFSLQDDGRRTFASLLADPAAGAAGARWRRGVALRVTWPPEAGPLLRLRPADGVMAPGRGKASAVVVAAGGGAASWELGAPFAGRGNVALHAGRQDVTLAVQSPDTTGVSSLSVTLTLPGGQKLEAHADVLVLPGGWQDGARRRVTGVRAAEQSSVAARLGAIAHELQTRHARDPVGALGSTVAEVEELLARAEASGTTLPAAGPYLAFLPAGASGLADVTDSGWQPPLSCAVHLPAGFTRDGRHQLLLLFLHAPGAEARGADQALRALAEMAPKLEVDPGRVAVVIPIAARPTPPDEDEAARVVAGVLTWAHALMPELPLAVAGVDAYASAVLKVSLAPPVPLSGVLLVTGEGFAPWPGRDDAALHAALAGADRGLSYGWIRFPDEAGPHDRALDIIAAMRETGLTLHAVQEVPGDLNASQAWGRAVIWAAGLP
jgi:hypothetical protein